jgi:hypothetical protein
VLFAPLQRELCPLKLYVYDTTDIEIRITGTQNGQQAA